MPTPKRCAVHSTALLGWLNIKLNEAEQVLKHREEQARVWRSGTDHEWDSAADMHPKTRGIRVMRADRAEEAAIHERIAARQRHEVEMFRATIAALSREHNNE